VPVTDAESEAEISSLRGRGGYRHGTA